VNRKRMLTIVAQDPKIGKTTGAVPFNGPLDVDQETDLPVREVMTILSNLSEEERAHHDIYRAHSVKRLTTILDNYPQKNELGRIQIIGHGAEGMLGLGAAWNNTYMDYPHGPAYVLDSNPNIYSILPDTLDPETQVWLIGCLVGGGDPIRQFAIANGVTLLFDLSQALGCEVSAPWRVNVAPSDFDSSTGIYKHHRRLMTVRNQTFKEPTEFQPPPSDTGVLQKSNIEFIKILSAPILGQMGYWDTDLDIHSPRNYEVLGQAVAEQIPHQSLLAMPELRFLVRWNERDWNADLLADRTVLRLRADDETHDFAMASTHEKHVKESVEELMEQTMDYVHE
jgi:hypothetical protein